jgi:predicted exporter
MRAAARWLAWAAAMAACAFAIARAPVVTDIGAFLPGPATAEQRLLAEQLREGVAARLILIGITAERAPQAAAAARALAARLRADAAFAFVADGDPKNFERERQLLFEARYLLSPQVTPQAFTEEGLRAAFARLRAQLTSALAPLVRPFAAADPTGELLAIAARLAPPAMPRSAHGAWFTPDGRSAIVLAETRAPGFDSDAMEAAIAAIEGHFRALAPAPDVRLELAGPGVFAVESRARIERDAERLSLAATALIGALLLAALRSPRFLLLAALPVASGAVAALAAVAWLFGAIHGITIGFGLTLIGEAVDYAIYVHLQRPRPGDAAGDKRLARALLLAVLTSSAGFLAMMLSGFRGLAQLGVFSLVGIVVAGAVARYYLPSLLPPAPPPPKLDWPPRRAGWLRALQVLVAVAVACCAAILLARAERLWNDELAAISPLAGGRGELDERLRGAAGLPQLRWIVALEADTQQEVLEAAEALRPALQALVDSGALAGFDSPADLLPSERTQRARQAALPPRGELQAALARALAGSDFAPEAFAPFVDDVERARQAPPLTAAYYADSALGQRLRAQLAPGGRGWVALVTLHGVDAARVESLRAAARAHGAVLLDVKQDIERLIADYRRTAVWAAAAGALLIVLLLAARLRRAAVVARIAVALAAAVIVTAGALVAWAGSLTLFHLVALLLVAGIGSNYAMFFARLPAAAEARRATLGSVLLAAATTFLAFALLATSATPVLHMIGATVAIGAVAALAASAACAAVEPSS